MSDKELETILSHITGECTDDQPCLFTKLAVSDRELTKIKKYLMREVPAYISKRDASRDQQIALAARKQITGGDMHEALMNYGKICEEQGFLTSEAVTIRMDLATYFYDLELKAQEKHS